MKSGGDREQVQEQIAVLAARYIAEDGLESAQARHKAALEVLGAGARTQGALPDHERIEAALREYLRTHEGEAHRIRLQKLRGLALEWMQVLADFQPHLVGPVLNGSATAHSHLHLHLFTDSAKDVEMALLDRGLDIRVGPADNGPAHAQEMIGFIAPAAGLAGRGRGPAADATPVLLTVLDTMALRQAPSGSARRQDPLLHPVERAGRANTEMLRALIDATSSTGNAEALHA